jgi:hypothetical protein
MADDCARANDDRAAFREAASILESANTLQEIF